MPTPCTTWVIVGLGPRVKQDYAQARQWDEKGATAGDADAMRNLRVFLRPRPRIKQDYTQARQWYEKAAAAGNPDAMSTMGTLYLRGVGVKQD